MKTIVSSPGGAVVAERPQPEPEAGEILVRVRAASLNRADLAGLSAADGRVMGMEWAGEVVAVGSAAVMWKPGDRVMCTGSGGFAEYAVTDAGRACAIPDPSFAFEDATVLTLALQAMHDAIVTHGRLRAGDDVLIHGASSAVGLMGLQIARLLGANRVFATSTNSDRRARLTEFGATHVVDPGNPHWFHQILDGTGGKGVEVVVDQVTGPDFGSTLKTAALGARVINLGRLGGAGAAFDFQLHALRRITYTGVTFRTRSAAEIRSLNAAMLSDLGDAIAKGKLRLPIDSSYPLVEAATAFSRMAANQHFGKIVLRV